MAPWCPACRGFVETWDKFSEWSKDLDIKVGVVDVTENPGQHPHYSLLRSGQAHLLPFQLLAKTCPFL